MKWIIISLLILLFLILIISFVDMNRLKVLKYRIKTNKISKNTRFVFLSDLHNNTFGKENARLLSEIAACKPDFVVLGGDMMVSNMKLDLHVAVDIIQKLTEQYKVYYALGNHEYKFRTAEKADSMCYEAYINQIACPNLHMLDNETVFLEEDKIALTGLSIELLYYRKFKGEKYIDLQVDSYVGKMDTAFFQILLAHNPTYFKSYDRWGADMILSGHLHGGIMRLPFLGGVISSSVKFFPKYDGGEFFGSHARMLVSRGLGAHTIPLRIFNPCELLCIDIEKDE